MSTHIPQISISIKPAPLAAVRDPQFQQAARELEDLYRAAPELSRMLEKMLMIRDQLIAALHIIKNQQVGDDWTTEQALAFIKEYAKGVTQIGDQEARESIELLTKIGGVK